MSIQAGDVLLVKEKTTGNLFEVTIFEEFAEQLKVSFDNAEETEWIETDQFHYLYSIEQFIRNSYNQSEPDGNAGD